MKPASIKKFDLLYWASIIIGTLGVVFLWGPLVEDTAAQFVARGVAASDAPSLARSTLLVSVGFGFAISVALWFLVSVARVAFAKWVLVVFTLFSLVNLALGLADGFDTTALGGIVSTGLAVAALYFLFTPDAKAWFAAKRGD